MSEALIQGSLPHPAEFEVYLGDTGIFIRQMIEEEATVGAGTAQTPVVAELYQF